MKKKIFIIFSRQAPSGPVKGAYALANLLKDEFPTTLVSICRGSGVNAPLRSGIQTICLEDFSKKKSEQLKQYKEMLASSGDRGQVISISLTLTADVFNTLCGEFALTCASVRGNLFKNYRYDYGYLGYALALFHLILVRRVNIVLAMSESMSRQLTRYVGSRVLIVRNFVDEQSLEPYRVPLQQRREGLRFIFVGSLSERKRPDLVIDAIHSLRARGYDARLEILGDGPERRKLDAQVEKYRLGPFVSLFGFSKNPAPVTAHADVLVLPSISEGISRAALEALYLGIPCVLRDVDAASELIKSGINGVLFSRDDQLENAMLAAIDISRANYKRRNILNVAFRQESIRKKFEDIFTSI